VLPWIEALLRSPLAELRNQPKHLSSVRTAISSNRRPREVDIDRAELNWES